MKVLVFNGSPKRNESDTMNITRAFLEGMNEVSKNEVEIINVIDKHIEYCTGCFGCMKNGGDCVHKDDMREILEKILKSDILIFNFPLYCYGMPAPLKALIDRTLPLSSITMKKVDNHYEHESQYDFSKLRYIMICGCGFPNSESNFEPAIMQFKQMFGNESTIITVTESPMFNVVEAESVTKPFLKVVCQAGMEYSKNGEVSKSTMEMLNKPMIPQEVYASIVNSGKF